MFGQQPEREREPGELIFHPMRGAEYNVPAGGFQISPQLGARPQYLEFLCGDCGNTTNGRVVCDLIRNRDQAIVSWCLCPCESPTIIVRAKTGQTLMHLPQPKHFVSDPKWPDSLRMLYDEAALAYSGSAFTACSMVCRKALMSCVCHEQQVRGETPEEGATFKYYVDYLATHILTFPAAKAPLDSIRDIGNEANHKVQFVVQPDAERVMNIVRHLFNTIYSLPAA